MRAAGDEPSGNELDDLSDDADLDEAANEEVDEG